MKQRGWSATPRQATLLVLIGGIAGVLLQLIVLFALLDPTISLLAAAATAATSAAVLIATKTGLRWLAAGLLIGAGLELAWWAYLIVMILLYGIPGD